MCLQINQEWIFIFSSFFLKLDFAAPLRLIGFQFAVEFSIVDVVSLVKTALSLNQTRYRWQLASTYMDYQASSRTKQFLYTVQEISFKMKNFTNLVSAKATSWCGRQHSAGKSNLR